MSEQLLPGYYIRPGSTQERSLLVTFMQQTYRELFPQQDFAHLARTVDQYFCPDTPLWWVECLGEESPIIACLWVGNAIDQVRGDRHAHIFLLYVVPEYRLRGIGTAMIKYVENWATQRGDRQIGLQVFPSNSAAFNLYHNLGYQTQSLWMLKSLTKGL